MNNIDGSYYAAVQLGNEYSRQLKENADAEADQKRYEEEKRRSWIQFWVPVIISLIALIKSFAPEIMSVIHAIID